MREDNSRFRDDSLYHDMMILYLNQSRHERSRHSLDMGGQTSTPQINKYLIKRVGDTGFERNTTAL